MATYITINKKPRVYQMTLNDILFGFDETKLLVNKNTRDTFTYKVDNVNRSLIDRMDFCDMRASLLAFVSQNQELIDLTDKSQLYRSFKIPKRSGGLRQIDAPNDELKRALYQLKDIFEQKFYFSYHTSAFAYVRGRNAVDSVRRHQVNKSRWFLKTDMKGFFPNTTPEFVYKMLTMTFPLCEFVKFSPNNEELLKKALSLCFLRGGLPQGTPISPLITNAMMIPIDHAISKMCHEHHPHLCYTRYADDILISSEYSFKWTSVQNKLTDILREFDAPFVLHPDKTRYGSSAGRNWNLGVMLNADNKITVGYAKKKTFKTMIFQFMLDYYKGNRWALEDVQHLAGLVSYYSMVEKESVDAIMNNYSKRFKVSVGDTIKDCLKAS